jgi:hypothetical protein
MLAIPQALNAFRREAGNLNPSTVRRYPLPLDKR